MVTEYYSYHMKLSVAGIGNKTTYHDKDQYTLFCISSNSFYWFYADWPWWASKNYLCVHKYYHGYTNC